MGINIHRLILHKYHTLCWRALGGGGASLAGSPGALSIYHVILDPFHFAAALAALAPAAKGSLSLRHGSPSPLVILDAKTRAYAEY